jgi:hypothetical protein
MFAWALPTQVDSPAKIRPLRSMEKQLKLVLVQGVPGMIHCLVARVLTTSQQVTGAMLLMWGPLGLRTLLLEALAMTKFFPMVCNTQTID